MNTTYTDLTFKAYIDDIVVKYKHNKAVGYVDEEHLTYEQLGRETFALVAYLEKLNIKPGDKVAILSQNMPNWVVAYLAMQYMGVITVPILPDFSVSEVENVLNHSETKAVFVSESLEPKLKGIEAKTLKTTISLNNFKVIDGEGKISEFDKSATFGGTYNPNENELAILLYTSGTTGNSKGVMLSQKNVLYNAFQSSHVQEINEHDRFLSILPLSHTYENTIGLLLPLLKGANVNYLRKPATPAVLLPALKIVKPHLMLTVPLIIEKIYRNRILAEIQKKGITRFLFRFKPSRKVLHRLAGKKLYKTFGGNLKFYGIGGAKLDATVEQFLRDAKFPYAIGYGLTETAPLLAGSNPTQTKLQAIGPIVKGCELKINNPDPHSGEGEIWAKGSNVMLGYYKNEAQTNEVLTPDGWFKTGDLGVFDSEGWLSHKGRLKNVIVGSNGENIYPEEIESVINNFRHVVESIVVQKKGQLVAMVHFNREELELRIKEMRENLSNRLDDKLSDISNKVDDYIEELSNELQSYINSRVNKFSKIQDLVIQNDPFQKTATQKIKRYLYS